WRPATTATSPAELRHADGETVRSGLVRKWRPVDAAARRLGVHPRTGREAHAQDAVVPRGPRPGDDRGQATDGAAGPLQGQCRRRRLRDIRLRAGRARLRAPGMLVTACTPRGPRAVGGARRAPVGSPEAVRYMPRRD